MVSLAGAQTSKTRHETPAHLMILGRRIDKRLFLLILRRLTFAGLLIAVYGLFIQSASFEYSGRRFYTLLDDAMISMRYARNLAEGHGLVWNPGEAPVEGYTNLLWTLWMAAVHLLNLPESYVSLAIAASGGLTVVVSSLFIRAIAARLYPQSPLIPVSSDVEVDHAPG